MAYTRIHNITTTLPKAIEYICDPEKTDGQLLVSGYNCEPYSAAFEFRATAALGRELKGDFTNRGGAENLAYHMIQSFSPYDNITPERAHELGRQWADEITGGRYEYVIATHIDKGHIHNHIIFNATSFLDYKKFNNYKIAARLREVSDRICIENGLYVNRHPKLKQRSRSRYEWMMTKEGKSWKAKIRDILNEAILQTNDWESFMQYIHDKGVDVKEGKRISFLLVGSGQERFCRGDRIHGGDYSREGILALLSVSREEKKAALAISESDILSPSDQFAAEIEAAAEETHYYSLQSVLDTLAVIKREAIANTTDFDTCISIIDQDISSAREKIDHLKELNSNYTNIAKYLAAYNEYKPLKEETLQKSGFQRRRFEALHKEDLDIFDFAAAQLEKNGIMTSADPGKVLELAKQKLHAVETIDAKISANEQRADQIRRARTITLQILAAAQRRQEQDYRGRSPARRRPTDER